MAKRYKAGTIFLDVVPSFKGVQDAIKKEVEKYNKDAVKNAEKLGEQTGTEQAEAHVAAAEKIQDRADKDRVIKAKGLNAAITDDSVEGFEAVEKAHRDSLQRQIKAAREAGQEISDERESEILAAIDADEKYINAREAAEAKARSRRSKEAQKERQTDWDREKSYIDDISKAWNEAYAERERRAKAASDYERDFVKLLIEDERDLADAMAEGREAAQAAREASQLEEARHHRLALKNAADEEKAQIKKWETEGKAAKKAADEERKEREKSEREERASQKRIQDNNNRIANQAAREARKLEKEGAKERERLVSASGGRIGKIIRKKIGGAIEDLPEMDISGDNFTRAKNDLNNLRAQLVSLRDANIGVDLSIGDARTKLNLLTKEIDKVARNHDGSVRINAMSALASLKSVNDEIDDVERKTSKPKTLRVFIRYITTGKRPDADGGRGGRSSGGGFGSRGAEDGANAFRIFNPLVALAGVLLAAIGPAAAVAAAGIVALGGTLVAAAGGFAVLILAFQGLFKAIQDQIKLDDELAQGDTAAAKQRVTAARQVRDAKERLADAEVTTARASEDAARRVSDAQQDLGDAHRQASDDIRDALEQQADAERRVEDAQRSASEAQRDLNEARREAKRDLQDLTLAYEGTKLDEKEAANAILQAQQRLNEVRARAASGDASQADVRAASIDVDQARFRAKETTVRRRRAGEDNARAQRGGVEGHEEVRGAKDRVSATLRDQADAQRDLQKATQNVAQVRRSSARSIAEAEQRVSDAIRDQQRVAQDNARTMRDAQQAVSDAQAAVTEAGSGMSTAAKNAQQSMDSLHPSAQRFAGFILGMRDDFKQLQGLAAAGVFPGLEAGMRELEIYGPGMRKFTADMGQMWGDTFRQIGKEMTGPTWRSFFRTMGQDGPRQAGLFNMALFNIVTMLAALTDAFSPLTTKFLVGFERMTGAAADWAANLKGSPGFERFLDYVYRMAPIVGAFFWELGRAVGNVAIALAPLGEGILKSLTWVFQQISEMDPKVLRMVASAIVAIFIAMQLAAGAGTLLTALTNPFTSLMSMIAFGAVLAVVALIYFYQTNDTVREKVDILLGKLKEFGQWLWDNKGAVAAFAGALFGLFVAFQAARAIMALRGAMYLLNLTLLGTPIGWIILGLVAFGAALFVLWKENEQFRNDMTRVWNWIKDKISAVIEWFKGPSGSGAMSTAFKVIGDVLKWVYKNVIVRYLNAWWKYQRTVFKAIGWFITNVTIPGFRLLGRVIGWVITKVILPIFRGLGRGLRTVWTKVIKPVLAELNRWWKQIIAPVFRWVYKNVIAPTMRAIGRVIRAAWNDVIKPTFRLLNSILRKIIAPVFRWIYKSIIKPIMNWVADHIGKRVGSVVRFLGKIRDFLRKHLGPAFNWLWKKIIRPVANWISDKVRWLWKRVKPNFSAMERGVDAVAKGFSRAKKAIGRAWDNLKSVISKPINAALRFIQKNFIDNVNKLLKKAGLELRIPTIWPSGSKDSGNKSKSSGKGSSTGSWKAAYATGGRVNDTASHGRVTDNVLGVSRVTGQPTAWVDHNEMVLQRRSTQRIDRKHPGLLDYMNTHGDLPGHARGGRVGSLPTYAKGGIVELGKRIQKMGYHVSEHPAFGGVVPGAHSASGYHYKGGALDINADAFNSKFKAEGPALDRLNRMLRSEGWNTIWRAANHYDHLHVDIAKGQKGGVGIFGGLADKALEFIEGKGKDAINSLPGKNIFAKMTKSLMKKSLTGFIDKIQGEAGTMDAGESNVRYSGSSKNNLVIGKDMASQVGWTGRQWTALRELWRRESTWNHRAVNASSGAYGIPQSLPASKLASAGSDWRTNPATQIRWGINYIKGRYGTPTGALAFHNRMNWYAKGTDDADPGYAMVGEHGPEMVRFGGGEQVYNRKQTMRMQQIDAQRAGGFSGSIYVQNPWTAGYHEAQMERIVEERERFNESISHMSRKR